ncbi:hypothetical protein AAMO2058_001055900, partial [Amorphochlora amoebiformis]
MEWVCEQDPRAISSICLYRDVCGALDVSEDSKYIQSLEPNATGSDVKAMVTEAEDVKSKPSDSIVDDDDVALLLY